jgi:class 3 adenylate cyclase
MAEERRLVTVLFADVAGSTAMGESLDPEDVRVLMGRYFDLARAVVEEHGGIVEKFIGDAVMAIFGLPQAHGDDAERAVSAGLGLQEGLAALLPETSLLARIGINTGEVVATGDVSRHEFLVTGDTVNTAARLEQLADPGQVLVGERTHRAARSFRYGRPLDLDARGKQHPLRAWPALGRGAPERPASRMPFLGREADLQQLHLIAARAFTERRPHLVTLTAPAGTGKSRLLEEFEGQLPDRYPGLRVATAQCVPYGQTLTYWPMRAILTTLAGIDRAASGAEVRQRLAPMLDEPEASRDADLIAMTVAPEEGHEQRNRDQIFSAWRRLLERLATAGPLLLVFEDLHWAADSLLDLVDNLMQPRTGAPLLVVSIARPELLDRRPTWGGGRRNYLHLALEPLNDDQIARLVELLMESTPPPAVRQLVVDRAGGNPFFATELTRALVDQGAVARSDDGPAAAPVLALPETVHATILSRLDLLDEAQRRVLQTGAVMGRTFRPSMLATIMAMDAATVQSALDGLLERELVVAAGPDEYAFAHILFREVAYQTLPRARRADDHAAVARLIESSIPERHDQLADLIALHYLEAIRLRRSLAFAGGSVEDDAALRRSAIYWLSRAARSGAAAGAIAEAVRQLSDAISLATPAEEMLLQEQLGEVFIYGDEALSAYQRAVELWRQLNGDATTGARLLGQLIKVYQRWQGSYSPQRRPEAAVVRQLNDEALALARSSGDERVLATVLSARSFFPFFSGDRSQVVLEIAQREAVQARDIFRRLDLAQQLSGSLDAVQSMAIENHDFAGALAVSQQRLEFFDRIADGIERLDALTMVASNAGHLGRVDEGLSVARLATFNAVGRAARFRFHLLSYLTLLNAIRGDWDAALGVVREAMALWEAENRGYLGIPHRNIAAGLYVAQRRGLVREAADIRNFLALTILTSASADPRTPIAIGYVRALTEDDPSLVAAVVPLVEQVPSAMATTERALALLAAYRLVPATALRLEQLLSYSEAHQLTPVTAHLLRMRSQLRGGDPGDLRRACDLLDASTFVPDAALTRLELFALSHEPATLERARRDLTRIGDDVGLQRASEVEASRG